MDRELRNRLQAAAVDGNLSDECILRLQFPEGKSAIREGNTCLSQALNKLGVAALGAADAGWSSRPDSDEVEHSTRFAQPKASAKDLRRCRHKLQGCITELDKRWAELRAMTEAIAEFRTTAAHHQGFALIGDDNDVIEVDQSEPAAQHHHNHHQQQQQQQLLEVLDLTTNESQQEHAPQQLEEPGGPMMLHAAAPAATATAARRSALADRLSALHGPHGDMLSELEGLRFALARLAEHAGRAADRAAAAAAAAMPLDRPLLLLAAINSVFTCRCPPRPRFLTCMHLPIVRKSYHARMGLDGAAEPACIPSRIDHVLPQPSCE